MRPRELERAISSVKLQGACVGEVIVVDDCSSHEVQHQLKQSYDSDPNIVLHFCDVNSGAQRARNIGIQAARYPVIALLDSDDEWLQDKLTHQLERLIETGADLVSCGVEFAYSNNTFKRDRKYTRFNGNPFDFILGTGGHLQTSTLVCRASVAKSLLFDETVKKFQDWDFVFRCFASGFVLTMSNKTLVRYHFGAADQMTQKPKPDLALNFIDRRRHMLGEHFYAIALVRVVARMKIEVGEIFAGFHLWFFSLYRLRHFDPIGLLKLVRKAVLQLRSAKA